MLRLSSSVGDDLMIRFGDESRTNGVLRSESILMSEGMIEVDEIVDSITRVCGSQENDGMPVNTVSKLS